MPLKLFAVNRDWQLKKISLGPFVEESRLQDWVERRPSEFLGTYEDEKIMIIAREFPTDFGPIDLLCIDVDKNLIVVELKKDRPPRDVIAQALEYTAWISQQKYDQIARIVAEKYPGTSLPQRFYETFEQQPEEESEEIFDETMYEEQLKRNFNRQQRIFIIAGQMLDRTIAVAEYLRKVGLDIVCVEARTSEDKRFLALWPTIAAPPPPPRGIREQAEELGLTELLEFLEEELTKERHLVKREERQWSIAFEISSVRRVLVTLYVRSPEVAVQPYFLKDTLAMVTDRDKLLNTLAEKLGPGAAAVTPGGDLKVLLRASDEGEKFLQVLRDDVFPSLESVSSA